MQDRFGTKKLTFGICADVHKDIMHDADQRLRTFIDDMNQRGVDFIIHLGDFCFPAERNRCFVSIWEGFEGPRYHTIGNHDLQAYFTRKDIARVWEMDKPYYSFDIHGYHFVVLDANEVRKSPPPSNPDFPSCICQAQFEWLRGDLLATDLPVFIFSHQTLEEHIGVDERDKVQELFREVNKAAGRQKIIATFCGDLHEDYCEKTDGIYNITLNSMSNHWMGEGYECIRYDELIDSHFPWIKYTAPYKDPLYAVVTLEPAGKIIIEGRESEFVGPSPQELGYPVEKRRGDIVPKISSMVLDVEL